MARFNANSDRTNLNCNRNPSNRNSGLGMAFAGVFIMKTCKNLYPKIYNLSNLILAWRKARKGKTKKDYIKEFRKKFPRAKFPESTIATAIIVGYPTETNEDFQKTINLIKKTKPEVLNISAFSSRQGTRASKLKQLDTKIVKEKTRKLDKVYESYRKRIV